MNFPSKIEPARFPLQPMKILLCLGVALFLATACYRSETRTIEVPVGHLGGEACFEAIQKALIAELIPRSNPNDTRIKSIKADYGNHAVIVEFKAKDMAVKNIERAIAKAGFTTYNPDGSVSIPAVGQPPQGCAKP